MEAKMQGIEQLFLRKTASFGELLLEEKKLNSALQNQQILSL
jgi:hypothetical protein